MENDSHLKPKFTPSPFFVAFLAIVITAIAMVVSKSIGLPDRSPDLMAYTEMKGIDLAVRKICADARVTSMRELFTDDANLDAGSPQEILDRHTEWMYLVLRKGNLADAPLKPERRRLLGDAYMELGKDPWKNLYVFYMPASSGITETKMGAIINDTYMEPLKSTNQPASAPVAVISAGEDGRLEFALDPPVFDENKSIQKTKNDFTNLRDSIDILAAR